jgi:hypothetical protein
MPGPVRGDAVEPRAPTTLLGDIDGGPLGPLGASRLHLLSKDELGPT